MKQCAWWGVGLVGVVAAVWSFGWSCGSGSIGSPDGSDGDVDVADSPDGSNEDVDVPEDVAAPVIGTFTATPSSVTSGAPTNVTWAWTYSNTPTPTPSCTIDHDMAAVSSGTATSVTLTAAAVFILTCGNSAGSDTAQTTITIRDIQDKSCNRASYGSDVNPTGNPIGGGAGYSEIIDPATADHVVDTKTDLLSALSAAASGQVIYVSDSASIDLSGVSDIVIPAGVTLASGRGRAGSAGALLFATENSEYDLFVTGGNGVRITGLRIRGPAEVSDVDGIKSAHDLEIDNNDVSFFQRGIGPWDSVNNAVAHIHHNFIHHNIRPDTGYGISIAHGSSALIEANIFDHNRHSIAATGYPDDSYTARYNIQLGNGSYHAFDMHGYDENSGVPDTNVAGEYVHIYSNTFYKIDTGSGFKTAVKVRGVPVDGAWVHDNYFYYSFGSNLPAVVSQSLNFGKIYVFDNCYDEKGDGLGTVENGIVGVTQDTGYTGTCVGDNWKCEASHLDHNIPGTGNEQNGCGAAVNGGQRRPNSACN